jgi:urocanate hydratase
MENDRSFKSQILTGIPDDLPGEKPFDMEVSHAPRRKDILSVEEKKLAVRNALRYFDARHHDVLAREFYEELQKFGRIYMYRFRPDYEMKARAVSEYPAQCLDAAAIMVMIQNNLDPAVAQHPHELITYGGNGAVFQNWAQYLLTMKYLATMHEGQTLHVYSGHPMGLFPSSKEAPRVVVTNGMMIPNYSRQDDWERYNALGVTQYGQMTAGSYMYIGPQGIVHGTTITILNAGRRLPDSAAGMSGKLFVSSGLGGMSGAQPKAAKIAGCLSVVAEVNEKAIGKRLAQGWVDEVVSDGNSLVKRVKEAKSRKEIVSIGYHGNIIEVWEKFDEHGIHIDLGSDQTSLHNPWAGGYYPVQVSFEESNEMIAADPEKFRGLVQSSLRRHVATINRHAQRGTYFFDYGNAFLLEASRAGAEVMAENGIDFRYPSYVQDIMGPMCFDYGFGPFRWVCLSGAEKDLAFTDDIACEVLENMVKTSPQEIHPQLNDNIQWIRHAQNNRLVVGSKARILYADAMGRVIIAKAFNEAIRKGKIGPVVLGRDHHDVSGTDSPYRETSNIYDGSRYTADMAIHNVIGDSFRGATWVSIHNGGGVGWGEVINGGFGLVLDGTDKADHAVQNMLYFDVTNGIARRAWARNSNALSTIAREAETNGNIKITLPNLVDEAIINECFRL